MIPLAKANLETLIKQIKDLRFVDNLYPEINSVLEKFLRYLIGKMHYRQEYHISHLEDHLCSFYGEMRDPILNGENTTEIGLATELPANLDSVLALPEYPKVPKDSYPCYLPKSRVIPPSMMKGDKRVLKITVIKNLVQGIAFDITSSYSPFRNMKLIEVFHDSICTYIYRTVDDCHAIAGGRPLTGEMYREITAMVADKV